MSSGGCAFANVNQVNNELVLEDKSGTFFLVVKTEEKILRELFWLFLFKESDLLGWFFFSANRK